ncbi:stalk domain-containing protein [Petroclostridium sp. X23]|uniref:stalk domain-containing protein n=1 Tax=Petroclostridium sp. X23 TaxID=3045146 RepID=UPI0024AD0A71|nr:stalk domain-containing protein [Petroclostridium sp. X23]WHH57391.1 TolC family protein [Petroclostridium sp. X23]
MKKRFLLLVSIILVIALSVPTVWAADNSGMIVVDGKEYVISQKPVNMNGTLMVPLRDVFEALGADVAWDAEKSLVLLSSDQYNMEVKPNSYFAVYNDETIKMSVKAQIMDGKIVIPLDLLKQMKAIKLVNYDVSTYKVMITTSKAYAQKDGKDTTEDDNTSNSLTYQQALEIALENSYDLKQAKISLEQSEDNRDDTGKKFGYSYPTGVSGANTDNDLYATVIGLNKADIALETAKKQIGITEEKLSYNVLMNYYEVLKKINNYELSKLSLQKAKFERDIMDIKYRTGLASSFEKKQAEKSYKDAELNLQIAEKSISDQQLAFNNLLEVDKNREFELVDQPKLEKSEMDEKMLEQHVARMISDSITVWLAEQNVKIAELNEKLYVYNSSSSTGTYKSAQLDVDKAKYSAKQTKSDLADNIRSIYYSIKQIEDQYEIYQQNLVTAQDTLELTRLKYDQGMATDSQLLDAEYNVAQIKKLLFEESVNHELKKIVLAKPWVG